MSHFFYRRSPRIIRETMGEEIEFHNPPSMPTAPTLNLISIMIPIVVTVAGAMAMMAFYQSTGNNRFVTVQIISLCTMVASYFVPVFVFIQQKSKHKGEIKRRNRLYEAHLNEERDKLQNWKNNLILNWHQTHLEPQFCTKMISERSSSIWERIPQDIDFLRVRVGIGTVPSGFEIRVPKHNGIEKDPLLQTAIETAARFTSIANAPALLDLNKYRVIGLVGEEDEINNFCRTTITQIATHHSPDETKIAAFFNQFQTDDWDWMRWIPHNWDNARSYRYLFQDGSYQPQVLDQFSSMLQRRLWMNKDEKGLPALPFYVCFLPYIEMIEHEPILPLLLKDSDQIGVCSIILASRKEYLPKECQLVIEIINGEATMRSTNVTGGGDSSSYSDAKDKVSFVQAFTTDRMTLSQADHFARQIAPYRMKTNSAAEIVNVLTLFDMFGIQKTDELEIIDKWGKSRYPNTLPFPVGVRGGMKPVYLNLHDKIERKGHGPHGLMAGTTGSGKSEVIQSMIASLAVEYHPHDLSFMLIDYKGGGMSNIFADLPHVIATVTNLEEEGLIERSKVSLKAELRRRQKLFVAAGNVQHIDEYYKTEWKAREPLPHLFIVIDEFAQLKKDQPEFMNELVSIAAIGRTLGVHLLLATQKPGGVVDDKIWSNSRYRICLRVQDEGDSREMLKIPDAAYITNPGRGYLQVGSNEVFESVQFAWSGAPYTPNRSVKQTNNEMYQINLDGSRTKARKQLDLIIQDVPKNEGNEEKQLSVLIQYIAERASDQNIQRLPGPWLEPLPEEITLEQLPTSLGNTSEFLNPKIGLIDDVANQRQFPLHIDLESGHWIIYGMPGTGKTTFIQTLLYSLAMSSNPDDVHVYAMDFGRMLKDYVLLPHVGDVIQDDEDEKLARLITFLEEQLNIRKTLLSDAGVKSRLAYAEETGNKLPALIIIIDGYLSFKNQFEKLHEKVEVILREGSSLGIYFMLTANRVSDIADKVRSNFPNSISFLLADAGDYHYAVGRLPKPPGQLPAGRGFVKGNTIPYEFHTALSVKAANESSRARMNREKFDEMNQEWVGTRASEIRILPDVIPLEEVWDLNERVSISNEMLSVGLRVDNLKPFEWSMAEGPFFVIGGRMESGKTSLLMTLGLISALTHRPDELQMYLCDFRRSSPGLSALKKLSHTQGYAYEEKSFEDMLLTIQTEIERRVKDDTVKETASRIMLLMDDAEVTAKRISGNYAITEKLEYIVRYGRENGVVIIVAGQSNDLNRNWDDWLKEVKSVQTGWILGTTDSSDLELLNVKIPYDQSGKVLPSGEGFYVKRKFTKVKVAHAFAHGINQMETQVDMVNSSWVNQINR